MRDPEDELQELDSAGLRRSLRRLRSPQGPVINTEDSGDLRNFSSNDYLGLADSPFLKQVFAEKVQKYGAGSGASRLVCGTMDAHLALEEEMAAFKRSEAALTFSTGFATATGVIPAVCQKDDIVILDKLCHASLIDGARMSGATIRVFPHNDLGKLESHLQWASDQVGQDGRILVVTESVFSMDGDRAPLREIVELKSRFGALLLVDEAHAFGIIGPNGRGLAAEEGLEGQIDFQMGTFSKALGLSGGYVCTSRAFVDLLVNRARSFIYSTAPAPALAATISEAVRHVRGTDGDALRKQLWENIRFLREDAPSAILPILMGSNEDAMAASTHLLEQRFLVPAIRYPTVPRGTARLRVTVSAAHDRRDVIALRQELDQFQKTALSHP